jgi:hypothetical protein
MTLSMPTEYIWIGDGETDTDPDFTPTTESNTVWRDNCFAEHEIMCDSFAIEPPEVWHREKTNPILTTLMSSSTMAGSMGVIDI